MEIVTQYRTHVRIASRNAEERIRGSRFVVEPYFERHPEQHGRRLHRRARAFYPLSAAIQLATALRRYRASARELGHAVALNPLATLAALPWPGAMPLIPSVRRVSRLVPE